MGKVSRLVSSKQVVRSWYQENVQTRSAATRLNELSAAKFEIFSVTPSHHIGGSYEIIYYKDTLGNIIEGGVEG